MYELSANLEWLFTEAGPDTAARVRAAAAAGLPAVEIWSWRDKDIDALAAALTQTGVMLQTMCTEPMGVLVDPAAHEPFVKGLPESADVAERLNCPYLVVTAGDTREGVPAADQRASVVAALREAAALLEGRKLTLLLENLNSRVDHVGTFLDDTRQVIGILREVGSPHVKLLYDAYHSWVMGEKTAEVLADAGDVLVHVQIADAPGRGEPGSGSVDFSAELVTLRAVGYRGRLGLEYKPTTGTLDSLKQISAVARLTTHQQPE
jgi:hydroxypyruvate isomerase